MIKTPSTLHRGITLVVGVSLIILNSRLSSAQNQPIDSSTTLELQAVEIVTSGLPLPISRKTLTTEIDVDSDITATSGTAADIIKNASTINSNVEGQLTLKGQSDFPVFINGIPNILIGGVALEQLHSANIEKIKIYSIAPVHLDPEGSTGAIDVISKRDYLIGQKDKLSGSLLLSAGTGHKYNYSHWLSYRKNKLWISNGFTARRDLFDGSIRSDRIDYIEPFDSTQSSRRDTFSLAGEQIRSKKLYESISSIGYHLNYKHSIKFTTTFGQNQQSSNGDIFARFADNYVINSSQNETDLRYSQFSGTYNYTLPNKQLEFLILYSQSSSKSEAVIDETRYSKDWKTETGPGLNGENHLSNNMNQGRVRINYSLLWRNHFSIRFGGQGRMDRCTDEAIVQDRMNKTQDFNLRSENRFLISRNIYAAFLNIDNLKSYTRTTWQAGLRYELTSQRIQDNDSNQKHSKAIHALNPLLSLNHRFTDRLTLITRYGRRINRPTGTQLSPVELYSNQLTVNRGNPNLRNEKADVIEVEMKLKENKWFFTTTAFYRIVSDRITTVRQTEGNNTGQGGEGTITVNTFENIDRQTQLGIETYFLKKLGKAASIRGNVSLFNVKLTDINFNERKHFYKNGQLVITLPFIKNSLCQIIQRYQGTTIGIIEDYNAQYAFDFAIKKQLVHDKLSLSFIVKDLFNTYKFGGTVNATSENLAPNSLTTSSDSFAFDRESRIVYFVASYDF